jgi:hypothetical protein
MRDHALTFACRRPVARAANGALALLLLGTAAASGCGANGRSPQQAAAEKSPSSLTPGWTPGSLSPLAWYQAVPSSFTTAPNGGMIWIDSSVNGRNAQAPNAGGSPVFDAHGWDNATQGTVHFLGGQLLSIPNWSIAPAGTDQPITVMAVMRAYRPQNTAVAGWWSEVGAGVVWAELKCIDPLNTGDPNCTHPSPNALVVPDLTRTYSLGTSQMFTGPHDLGNDRHVVAWRYLPDTQMMELTVDGVPSGSARLPAIPALAPMDFIIGAKSLLPTGLFQGDISELVITDSRATDVVQNYTEYARMHWALPAQGSAADPCVRADGTAAPNGIRCTDGSTATQGDACVAGVCVGTAPLAGNPGELSPLAWYHAGLSEVGFTDGGVSTWFDRSPRHIDISQGFYVGRPGLALTNWTGATGNKPTLHFTGANLLRYTEWSDAPLGDDAAFTVMAVIKPNAPNENAGIATWWNPANYDGVACQLKAVAGTTPSLFRSDTSNSNQSLAVPTDLGLGQHIVIWRYTPETIKITIDGVTHTNLAPMASLGPIGATDFIIGAANDLATNLFNGEVAELAVIKGSISNGAVVRLDNYAQAEWGGLNLCAPSCSSKGCGADDGCGGTCDCGAACTADSQCGSGMLCMGGQCTAPNVPATIPQLPLTGSYCDPDFQMILDPNGADANHDGFVDIVALTPRTTTTPADCPVPAYCTSTIAADGTEQFTPVTNLTPVSSAFPLPAAAVTNGCSAEDAATLCPIIASTGQPALGCDAEPAETDCQTVTMCPDPGAVNDPNDPTIEHTDDGLSATSLSGFPPPGSLPAIPGEIRQILSETALYVNPCEWQPVLDTFNYAADIKGDKKPAGEVCVNDSECQSGACTAPGACQTNNNIVCFQNSDCGSNGPCNFPGIPLNLVCTPKASPIQKHLREGSSKFNVTLDGGVSTGRAAVKRVIFFPSAEFDVSVNSSVHLTTAAFGHDFNVLTVDIASHVDECGYKYDWHSRSGDDEFLVSFIDNEAFSVTGSSDAGATANCQNLLGQLHQAEENLNQAFHDALIATLYYNAAGPTGTVITSRAVAQSYIDAYEAAAAPYQAALAAYKPAQSAALNHHVGGEVADLNIDLDLGVSFTYPIGPFDLILEIGIYGRAGLKDAELANYANVNYTNTTATPCAGSDCFDLGVKGSVTPKASAGIFAFVGVGINLGVAGGRVGIRGEVDAINAAMPLVGEFALNSTTEPPSALLAAIPSLPPPLNVSVPTGTNGSNVNLATVANLVTNNLFVVPPLIAQINAPYAAGGALGSSDDLTVGAEVLSGRIELWAKVWVLGFHKKWTKVLASWQGIHHSWLVGSGISGDAINLVPNKLKPIVDTLGFLPAPNMVLLPKLALLPVPGFADPQATSDTINAQLDTQYVPVDGAPPFKAHEEKDIGRPWTSSNAGGRCDAIPIHETR